MPNSLIDSYAKCGSVGLDAAMRLFFIVRERDVVTWNSMIGELVKDGELESACTLFDEMLIRNLVSWNTMIDGYAKAREMKKAFELFERMPEKNDISWSMMVCGYSKAEDMSEMMIIAKLASAERLNLSEKNPSTKVLDKGKGRSGGRERSEGGGKGARRGGHSRCSEKALGELGDSVVFSL
ncbi:pentatricopeptide repeat-containing protein At3g29230-like [Abrus precatorius]|uniref:Pentatricopeptide repeat-containing protein At3g29230-like n=1 Tax=Abrus precatorius TaxID=3816 RepID=A0A8B8M1Q7_ABRPR|nr:pentatricopeptide repeat-containing protein At3g29230-like [Abrus precatorius]